MSLESLKNRLLTPLNTTISINLLGVDCHIRRVSTAYMQEYYETINQASKDNDNDLLNKTSVSLLLDALVDENGNTIPKEELPTCDELIAVHDSASLIEAVKKVQEHSIGTLEDAEKN